MPGTSVTLGFAGGAAEVDEAGAVTLHVEGLPGAVRVTLRGARLVPVLADAEEAEHEGRVAASDVGQRVTAGEHCQFRWVVDVPEDAADATLELDVTLEDTHAAWLWPSGAEGFVVVLPRRGAGPVLVLHTVQAELRISPAARQGDGRLRLAITPSPMPAGRQVVILRATVMPALIAAATLLPSWYEPVTLDVGDEWTAPLADLGLDCEPPVTLDFTEDESQVRLTAPSGKHRVGVHGRRGVTDLVLEVAPAIADVLAEVAEAQRPDDGLDGAAAFVLHRAVESGLLQRTPAVEDSLDRFDWSEKPGALAVAFGSERALAEGEREMARVALQRSEALEEGPGRPRVRSLVWLAASALGVGSQPPPLGDGDPDLEGLEVDLALGRRTQASTDRLAAAINSLGAGLPGQPVGLGLVEQAQLIGLLETCPDDWPEAPLAGFTAQAARRRILASYATGEVSDPTPLAWLLVYG